MKRNHLQKKVKADDKKQYHYHIDMFVSSKKSSEDLWDFLFENLDVSDLDYTITDVRLASDEEINTWVKTFLTKEDVMELKDKDHKTVVQIIRKKAGVLSPSFF